MKKLFQLSLGLMTVAVFLLTTTPVSALNVQHFRPGTGATKGYQLYTSDSLQQGQFAAGVVTNYAQHLLKIQPPAPIPNQQIVDELIMIDFLIDIGIMDWLTLSLDIPMTGYHNIQATPVSTGDQGGAAMGDIQARLKFTFFEAAKTSTGLGLALVPAINIPTGSVSTFVGDAKVNGQVMLVGDWQFLDVNRFYVNGGFLFRGKETIGAGPGALTVDDQILYGLGFTRPLWEPWDFDMIVEGYGSVVLDHTSEERGYPLELLFMMQKGWMERHLVSSMGAGWGATEGYGTPNFRVFLGLSYVSSPPTQQMVPVKVELIAIDEKIHFQFDKAVIRPKSYHVLDQVVQVMQTDKNIKLVEVAGFTDAVGNDDYNQRLSERRSKSVIAYLTKHGVARDRLVAKGYGEADPVATNDTAEGRALNRRTEFRILERK